MSQILTVALCRGASFFACSTACPRLKKLVERFASNLVLLGFCHAWCVVGLIFLLFCCGDAVVAEVNEKRRIRSRTGLFISTFLCVRRRLSFWQNRRCCLFARALLHAGASRKVLSGGRWTMFDQILEYCMVHPF